ncbi:RagB/SusD family nutrient uptake outer membrane protein [Dyadobacter frigoris]|uniref:RagB/SusD family nutrient uptake outer membrane protein n=1 Tax=Dyadobacter frigoris TaxID=2576211 RepID=A0A4U6CQL3_9BACT|nr:RagB/SusD family nutrient uptake outer membrane protein [Dyadobacter frigoris]TKT85727.1 RagB/SusD family nutrient uptake outer membrane protein [Dyadobacter frigoris]
MKNSKKRIFKINLIILLGTLFLGSCQVQDDWLNAKRDKSDITPKSLDDFQAVLDNSNTLNKSYPMLGMMSTDNVFLPDNILGSVSERERNAYSWAKDIFKGSASSDFAAPYIAIGFCNIVLEGISGIKPTDPQTAQLTNIKGQALFHRAMSLYNLSQLFCKPFNPSTAGSDLGLQLKVSSDPNEKVKRSSVQETYEFILSDLKAAIELLPDQQLYTTRPSRKAALALLSKVHLSMQDYKSAAEAASLVLGDNPVLLDFNEDKVKPTATYVFPAYSNQMANDEIIFFAYGITLTSLWPVNNVGFVDSLFYQSYHVNDLRKTLFYKTNADGLAKFTGAYTGSFYNFSGIATNEILLVLAESLARTGETTKALLLLDSLLVKRFKSGTYQKLTVSADQVLAAILEERRKELPFTGQLRWEDLRRLNQDPKFAKTLTKLVNGVKLELAPNGNRYVFPFPDQEILLSSVQQNDR